MEITLEEVKSLLEQIAGNNPEQLQLSNSGDENEGLDNDLTLDSIAAIQLIVVIEQKYGIEIPDEELLSDNLKNLESITDLARRAYLAQRMGE